MILASSDAPRSLALRESSSTLFTVSRISKKESQNLTSSASIEAQILGLDGHPAMKTEMASPGLS